MKKIWTKIHAKNIKTIINKNSRKNRKILKQKNVKIKEIVNKTLRKNYENCKQKSILVHFARIIQAFYEPILQFDTMSNFQNPFQNPILKVHTTFGHAWLHLTSAKT